MVPAVVTRGPDYVPTQGTLEAEALAECRRIWRAHPDLGLELYLAVEHVRELGRPGPGVPTTPWAMAHAVEEVQALYLHASNLP